MAGSGCSFVLFGALAGGFVSGLAGFDTGLVALGIWLHVIEPRVAASLVVVCSVVSQAQTIPTIWHAIRPARLWPFIEGLIGVAIGTMLLARVDPGPARRRHTPRGVLVFCLPLVGAAMYPTCGAAFHAPLAIMPFARLRSRS